MCTKPIATKIFYNEKNYENEKKVYDKNDKILKRLDPAEEFFLSSYENCDSIGADEVDKIQQNYQDCDLTNNSDKKEKTESFNIFKLKPGYNPVPQKEFGELDFLNQLDDESDIDTETDNLDFLHKLHEESDTDNLHTINFSFLGIDLRKKLKLITKENFYQTILVPFENLFKAVELLNRNKIYHCDIKPENIVYDNNNKSNTFKLIDFGLAIFDEISREDIIIGFTSGYVSPEFYYRIAGTHIGYGFIEDRSEFKKDKDETIITFTPNVYKFSKTNKTFSKFDGTNKQNINTSYYEELLDNNSPLLYSKNDIWALGCVLKDILEAIVQLFNKESNKTTSPSEIIYFKNISSELNKVIRQILILNVHERPNASVALKIYTAFLKNINPANILTRGRTASRTSRRNRSRSSSIKRSISMLKSTRRKASARARARLNKTNRNRTKRGRTRQ
jgi:serine/threonine protein kinase